jgi:hypothetical protein
LTLGKHQQLSPHPPCHASVSSSVKEGEYHFPDRVAVVGTTENQQMACAFEKQDGCGAVLREIK